jgi:ABC-type Fe3+ transport system permease subunit
MKLVLWIVVAGLIALVLLITLISAAVSATVLVDQIPGADAGLATSQALDSAYRTMSWSSLALLGVVVAGVVSPLLIRSRRGVKPAEGSI